MTNNQGNRLDSGAGQHAKECLAVCGVYGCVGCTCNGAEITNGAHYANCASLEDIGINEPLGTCEPDLLDNWREQNYHDSHLN